MLIFKPLIKKDEKLKISKISKSVDHTMLGKYKIKSASSIGNKLATIVKSNSPEKAILTSGTNKQFNKSAQPET